MSAETKAKIGAANRGRTKLPELRARLSEIHKARAVSPQERAANGSGARRFWAALTDEQRAAFLAKRREGRQRYLDNRTPEQREASAAVLRVRVNKARTAYCAKLAAMSAEERRQHMTKAWNGAKASGLWNAEHMATVRANRHYGPLSEDAKAKMSASRTGVKRTEEAKKILRAGWAKFSKEERRAKSAKGLAALKAQWDRTDPNERLKRTLPGRIAGRLANPSGLERAVAAVLDSLGVEYLTQAAVGTYVADFLVPDRALVIECDGSYWHNLPGVPEKDRQRDEWMRSAGYSVLRLGEKDIRSGRIIEPLRMVVNK